MNRRFHLVLGAVLLSLASARGANAVVNLSHYDEMVPDFSKMSREGIYAAIHEATYPRFAIDGKYAGRQGLATRAGLLWGAYHFGDGTDPSRQADHFVDVVRSSYGGADSGVLMVLDFEKNDHYPGGSMTAEQAAAFVERIRQRTGKYPGVYGSENRLKFMLNRSTTSSSVHRALSNCWLWVANYHAKPSVSEPWSRWTMWQYTGDGICDLPRAMFPIGVGNIRRAERNLFNGSVGSLKSFWNSNAWTPGR